MEQESAPEVKATGVQAVEVSPDFESAQFPIIIC